MKLANKKRIHNHFIKISTLYLDNMVYILYFLIAIPFVQVAVTLKRSTEFLVHDDGYVFDNEDRVVMVEVRVPFQTFDVTLLYQVTS